MSVIETVSHRMWRNRHICADLEWGFGARKVQLPGDGGLRSK
jgi:hypothetical protein